MFSEVWPAFIPNLLSVAGEWAGWEKDFIQQRVLECYKRRIYISWRLNPIKRFFCPRWVDVVEKCMEIRKATT